MTHFIKGTNFAFTALLIAILKNVLKFGSNKIGVFDWPLPLRLGPIDCEVF